MLLYFFLFFISLLYTSSVVWSILYKLRFFFFDKWSYKKRYWNQVCIWAFIWMDDNSAVEFVGKIFIAGWFHRSNFYFRNTFELVFLVCQNPFFAKYLWFLISFDLRSGIIYRSIRFLDVWRKVGIWKLSNHNCHHLKQINLSNLFVEVLNFNFLLLSSVVNFVSFLIPGYF